MGVQLVSDSTMEDNIKQLDTSLDSEEESCSSSVSSDSGESLKKQCKLASSFELGDEQPQAESLQGKRKEEDSFHNLFGPPSLVETPKPAEIVEIQKIQKTVKKPLPVNPLTGAVMGIQPKEGTLDKGEVPKQSKPKSGSLVELFSMPIVQVTDSGRQPPGGHHSPLW